MDPVAKLIIIAGVVLILVGIFWSLGSKYLHLGRLPGDIVVERPGFKFYFRLTTAIIISILLTLFFFIYRVIVK